MHLHKRIVKTILLKSSLVLAAVVISLFISDVILGFLNFPSDVPRKVAHPINHEEIRQNFEFQYVFKTNSRGLRYREIPAEKPAKTYRIFVSGDSYTEGFGVKEGERFTDLLEKDFSSSSSQVQFINGGLTGTGPSQYGRLFLDVGRQYNPDALLICLFVNDVVDTSEETSRSPVLVDRPVRTGLRRIAHRLWPRVFTVLKTARQHQVYLGKTKTSDFISAVSIRARDRDIPLPQIERWKASLPEELVDQVNQGRFNGGNLSSGLLYPQYWSDSIDISRRTAGEKWNNMSQILSGILSSAKQSGIDTAVVLIPAGFMYDPKSHNQNNPFIMGGSEVRPEWLSEDTEIQKRMFLWARSEKIPFLDLTPVFREAIKSNKSYNWKCDGHWNALGHQTAAKAIASWICDEEVFPFVKVTTQTPQTSQ